MAMKPLSIKRHRFPLAIICDAVWLYFRFTMSLWDVEDLLAERGIAQRPTSCCSILPSSVIAAL